MMPSAPGGTGYSRLRRLVREATDVAGNAAPEVPGVLGGGAANSDADLAAEASPAGVGAGTGAVAGADAGTGADIAPTAGAAAGGACEFCAAPIPAEHRHLWERASGTLLCVCRACALLFDRPEAGEGRYRLIPERVRSLDDFVLDDELWDRLDLPVELAFFQHADGDGERVLVRYPGALGAVESSLGAEEWAELEARNPVLRTLEPEVEALLINRTAQPAQYWILPLDICYALVGVIRRNWKGLGGGEAVWEEVATFFEALRWRAE